MYYMVKEPKAIAQSEAEPEMPEISLEAIATLLTESISLVEELLKVKLKGCESCKEKDTCETHTGFQNLLKGES